MNFVKYIERIKYLDELIRKENTGTPDDLANKLKVSRAQVYNIMELLKEKGMKIRYARGRNTFYYASDKKLEIIFSLKVITPEESAKVFGGYFIASNFFRRTGSKFSLIADGQC